MASLTLITPTNYKEFLSANESKLVVLFFDAPFTDQKAIVDKAINSIKEVDEFKDSVIIGQVDVEECNDLAVELDVNSVPAVLFIYKGSKIRRVDTLEATNLPKLLKEELTKQDLLAGKGDSSSASRPDDKDKFTDYLKSLTNRAPVMLFMKGNSDTPRCGFSKQIIALLNKHKVEYKTFDILLDEQVRQGLKEFSDWPTYPQLYVKGEFIGGLDIVKQLDDSGELASTLGAS